MGSMEAEKLRHDRKRATLFANESCEVAQAWNRNLLDMCTANEDPSWASWVYSNVSDSLEATKSEFDKYAAPVSHTVSGYVVPVGASVGASLSAATTQFGGYVGQMFAGSVGKTQEDPQ